MTTPEPSHFDLDALTKLHSGNPEANRKSISEGSSEEIPDGISQQEEAPSIKAGLGADADELPAPLETGGEAPAGASSITEALGTTGLNSLGDITHAASPPLPPVLPNSGVGSIFAGLGGEEPEPVGVTVDAGSSEESRELRDEDSESYVGVLEKLNHELNNLLDDADTSLPDSVRNLGESIKVNISTFQETGRGGQVVAALDQLKRALADQVGSTEKGLESIDDFLVHPKVQAIEAANLSDNASGEEQAARRAARQATDIITDEVKAGLTRLHDSLTKEDMNLYTRIESRLMEVPESGFVERFDGGEVTGYLKQLAAHVGGYEDIRSGIKSQLEEALVLARKVG